MINPRWATCLVIVVIILTAQIAFGATEHAATLEAFAGEVKVLQGGTASVTPALRMVLRSKDVIYTGKSSTATIVFPDGSAIQLEPKTRFTVQLLEYVPGGPRRRSFALQYGAVVARISHFFGVGSKASISTPTAVAAARGTGFRLSYDPLTKLTILSVADGTVEFTCGGVTILCHAGESIIAKGHKMGGPQETPQTIDSFASSLGVMGAFEAQQPAEPLPALEPVLPAETRGPTETAPQPPAPILPVEPVVLPSTANVTPAEMPTPPPFAPTPPEQVHQTQAMDWTLPGILGAGVLAAVLLQNDSGSRVDIPLPPTTVPEPASLLVLIVGISGFAGMVIRKRRRTTP